MTTYTFWELDFNQRDVFNELTNIVNFLNKHWRDITNLNEIWNNITYLCDGGEDYDGLDFYEFKTKDLASSIINLHIKHWYLNLEDDFSLIIQYLINQSGLFDRQGLEDINSLIVTSWLFDLLMNEVGSNSDYKNNLVSLVEEYSNIESIKDITNSYFVEKDWLVVSYKDYFDNIEHNFYRTEKDRNWETKFDYRSSLTYFHWIKEGKEDITPILKDIERLLHNIKIERDDLFTIEGLSKSLVKFILIESLKNNNLLDKIISSNNNWTYFKFNNIDYFGIYKFLTTPEWVKLTGKEVVDKKQKKIKDLDLSEIIETSIFEDWLESKMIDTSYEVFKEQLNKGQSIESYFKIFKNKVEEFDDYLEKVFSEFSSPYIKELVIRYWSDKLITKLYKNEDENPEFAKKIFSILWEGFFSDMTIEKMKMFHQITYKDWMVSRIWKPETDFIADYDVINKAFQIKDTKEYLKYFGQYDSYLKEFKDPNWNKTYKDILLEVLKDNNSIWNEEIITEYLRRSSYSDINLMIDYISRDTLLEIFSTILDKEENKVNWLTLIDLFHNITKLNWQELTSENYMNFLKILSKYRDKIEHYFTVVSEIYNKLFSGQTYYEKKIDQIEKEKEVFTDDLDKNMKDITKSISSYKGTSSLLWKINKFFGKKEDEVEVYKLIIKNLEYITETNKTNSHTLEKSLEEIEKMLKTSNYFKENITLWDEELGRRFLGHIEQNDGLLNLSKQKMELYLESYKNIWLTLENIKEKLKTLDVLVWMKLLDDVDQDISERIDSLKVKKI